MGVIEFLIAIPVFWCLMGLGRSGAEGASDPIAERRARWHRERR